MATIKQNTFYNILLNISSVAFPIVTTPYISRVLGVENVGIVSFANAYATYFVLFAMLGIPRYGLRVIAQHNSSPVAERQKAFSELFFIVLFSSLMVSVIYLVSIFSIESLYQQRDYLMIAGITVLLSSLNIEWFFSGRENFKIITIRSIIIKVVVIAGMFVFVRTSTDLIPYMLLSSASLILNHIWNWTYLYKYEFAGLTTKNLQLKKHIKPTLLLFGSVIAISIYTIMDTIMLGFMSTYAEVGYYTSALKITKLIMPITTAMSMVVFVKVSASKTTEGIEQTKDLLKKSFDFMFTLATPLVLGIICTSADFVPVFFGPDFLGVIPILQLLSLLILIIGLSNLYGIQIVQALGKDKAFLCVVLCGTVINLILNTLLIGRLGAIGATISSITAEIAIAVIMFIISLRYLRIKYQTSSIIQPIVSSLPIVGIYFILEQFQLSHPANLAIQITLSVSIYFILMCFVFKNGTMLGIISPIFKRVGINL